MRLLLGLGNYVYSNFKNFIEKKSNEEIEAQEMSFIAEISHDEALVLLEDLKKEVEDTRKLELS